MLTETIPDNTPSSQSPSTKLDPVQKLPSLGLVKVDLKDARINFIKRYEPFTWYVTLTFKEPKHPESADKAFFRWIRHINECLYGRRYREKKKGVTCVKCMEYQKRDKRQCAGRNNLSDQRFVLARFLYGHFNPG